MTDRRKKARLRAAIKQAMHPVHCSGCDGWGCGIGSGDAKMEAEDTRAAAGAILKAVWGELGSWEKETP